VRRFIPLAVAAVVLSTASAAGARTSAGVSSTPAASPEAVVVQLAAHADLSGLARLDRRTRLRTLVNRLQAAADTSQAPLLQFLAERRKSGLVTRVRPLWILNAVAVTAPPSVIQELAARPEVAAVAPEETIVAPATSSAAFNVALVNATGMWNAGARGQGVVVANLDTGVDIAHPELASRWRGGTNSWYDPYGQHPTTPTDISGHGTQTMGVMVAGDASGTALGVAPDARWIAAKVFNDSGSATTSAIHLAFQWVLDPDHNPATADAPQVVNNSWSMQGRCDTTFQPDIASLRAAGILPVFAAGNNGPLSPSDQSPANNPGALSVGSVDATDTLAPDSSRGPSACDGAVFPDVTAPGVGITSTDLFQGYATASGTSLAAPHVAGALALLLSGHPNLSAAAQEQALQMSAHDLGPGGPDGMYGYGRVDAVAALSAVATLDTTGPVVSGPSASQDGATLLATVSDTQSPVAAAEWYEGADPGAGHAHPMAAADGAFDSQSEGVSADIRALAPGTHTLALRGRDAAGNWGPPVTLDVAVSDTAGPVVSGASVSADGTALRATVTDTQSSVAAAEWFEGADPGVGGGQPITASDGAFDSVSEVVAGDISGLTLGVHTISVRGRDAAGNWGPVTTLDVTVADTAGPAVSGQSVSSDAATLHATVTDGRTGVAAAEWFDGTDPGAGRGRPMTAVDGAFDSVTEAVSADIRGLAPGYHALGVRGRDTAGNWGSAVTVAVTIAAPGLLFADGFAGTFAAWSFVTGANGLAVTPVAALHGSDGYGMQATVGGTPPRFVTDGRPAAERSYHARFYFHPHSSLTNGNSWTIFAGRSATGVRLFSLQYRATTTNGGKQLRIAVLNQAGTVNRTTAWYSASNTAHAVELAWDTGARRVSLSVDGISVATLTALAITHDRLDKVELGPSAGLTSAARAVLWFDDFVSTRNTPIGP
jgi:subtilisin family serine protease